MDKNIYSALSVDENENKTQNNENISQNDKNWTTINRDKKNGYRYTRQNFIKKYIPRQDYERKPFHDKNENIKKIFCKNIINEGKCRYGNMCLYAHNLEEQQVDDKRQRALDILHGNDDLSDIDLQYDKDLYREFRVLTKICDKCIIRKCEGGYNCRHGSCLEENIICYNDLHYGQCKTENCTHIHLSTRGLKPYYKNVKRDIHSSFVTGTKITDEYFVNLTKISDIPSQNKSDENDSISSESIPEFINLDDDEEHDDNCELSIFNFINIQKEIIQKEIQL